MLDIGTAGENTLEINPLTLYINPDIYQPIE